MDVITCKCFIKTSRVYHTGTAICNVLKFENKCFFVAMCQIWFFNFWKTIPNLCFKLHTMLLTSEFWNFQTKWALNIDYYPLVYKYLSVEDVHYPQLPARSVVFGLRDLLSFSVRDPTSNVPITCRTRFMKKPLIINQEKCIQWIQVKMIHFSYNRNYFYNEFS